MNFLKLGAIYDGKFLRLEANLSEGQFIYTDVTSAKSTIFIVEHAEFLVEEISLENNHLKQELLLTSIDKYIEKMVAICKSFSVRKINMTEDACGVCI